jgi:hypothetical protein
VKQLSLLLPVLSLLVLAGCDGDSVTTVTAGAPVTLSSGNMTITAGSNEQLAQFTVAEPGEVRVTVTWSAGPTELVLLIEAQGGAMAANIGGSPLVTTVDITQAILNTSNVIAAGVINNDVVNADVQFTVVFTPAI